MMKPSKYPSVLGYLLFFLILVKEVQGQLEVTAIIQYSNYLKFSPKVYEEFHACMCSQKVTCTISFYYYFTSLRNEYIVNTVSPPEDKKSSSEEPTHYICNLAVFGDNSSLDCNLQNITDNACSDRECSSIASVQNTGSCPCISLQWIEYVVSYICGQGGQCDENIAPKENKICPTPDGEVGDNSEDGRGEGNGGEGEDREGDSDESSGDNQTVAIGAGLGSALAIVIIIAAIALYIIWQRKKAADRHVDRVQESQPNSYVNSKISYKGNRKSVDSSHEDNYGYTDYVEPGSMYYEIGDDGELAACRDEVPDASSTHKAAVAEDAHDQIGSEGDGYNKLNAVKNISGNVLATYDTAAGRLEAGLRMDTLSADDTSKTSKEEELSYSMARPLNGENVIPGGGSRAMADHPHEMSLSTAPGNDYFVLEAEEDIDDDAGKDRSGDEDVAGDSNPSNPYF